VTFFGDLIFMMSLKWHHNYIFEVRFRHNELEKTQFGQITKLQVTNIEGKGAIGAESPQRLAIFEKLLLK